MEINKIDLCESDKENIVNKVADVFKENAKGLSIIQICEILELSKDAFSSFPVDY